MKTKLPAIAPWLLGGFRWYARHFVRRHFHRVRLAGDSADPATVVGPMVVYLNHAAWWDPLICLLVAEQLLPRRAGYAPIEAAALARYRFFARLGFFGVDGSPRGSAHFLRTALAILQKDDAALWITPQGEFTDARLRPVRLRPGLEHLRARTSGVAFVPLAMEYGFGQERLPAVSLRFGPPVRGTEALAAALEREQDALAAATQQLGDGAAWLPLLSGPANVQPAYDAWRAVRSRLRGEDFSAAHHHQHAEEQRP